MERGGEVMQDFLLIIIVLAAFIFGWFIMKKVDIFMEECKSSQMSQFQTDGMALRIGFANPLVADSISNALEQYSKQYPDISVCMFHGDAEELLRKVAVYKLDIVILPEQADIPSDRKYKSKKVIIASVPVIMKYGGLPIEAITDGKIAQTLVWLEDGEISAAAHLVKCIENETSYA